MFDIVKQAFSNALHKIPPTKIVPTFALKFSALHFWMLIIKWLSGLYNKMTQFDCN